VRLEKEKLRIGIFKSKKSKIFISGAIIILIIAATVGIFYTQSKASAKTDVQQQTAKVMKGNLSVTVSGSGPITSSSKADIYSSVNSNITKIYFKDGDQVKAGDLLMELEDFDANLKVKQLENTIAQTQLTQNSNIKSLKGISAISTISGEVSGLQIKVGDNVAKSAALMTITDKSKLSFVVPFNNIYRKELHNNQQVVVNTLDTTLDDTNTVAGYITNISAPSYKTSDGSEVYNVEVVVNNPGALKEGLIANAEIDVKGDKIISTGSGTMSYLSSAVIRSESGGVIEKINVIEGQLVSKGMVLAELQNDDLMISKETTALKIEDLNNQLDSAKKQLAYYKVSAPIDGVLNLQSLKVSDAVKQSQLISSVTDYGKMEFEIPIDELDIAKIQIGQQVNVSIDALTETTQRPLKGIVSKIAVEGTSSNGVTTYPVTIQINDTQNVKSGMNANAEILVSTKSNALYLPVQAVQKRGNRSIVMVKGAAGNQNWKNSGTSNNTSNNQGNQKSNTTRSANGSNSNAMNVQMQKYYAGTMPKQVKTGINNEAFIEIVSGLNEGDVVILPPVSSSQSGTQAGQSFGQGGGLRIPMGGGGGNFGGGNNGGGKNGNSNTRGND
jgi:HlyD family secretion protein